MAGGTVDQAHPTALDPLAYGLAFAGFGLALDPDDYANYSSSQIAPETYKRWRAETPPGFRFSVKLPRSISHDARLRHVREPLLRFLAEVAGLGDTGPGRGVVQDHK